MGNAVADVEHSADFFESNRFVNVFKLLLQNFRYLAGINHWSSNCFK